MSYKNDLSRLKVTLLSILKEEGLYIHERQTTGTPTKEIPAVLVDLWTGPSQWYSPPTGIVFPLT